MQKIEHHLTINDLPLIDACQTLAYIRGRSTWPSNVPRPDKGWMAEGGCCDNFDDYNWPAADGAWWYDADIPASAEFFGFLPTSMELSTPYGRTRGTDFRVGQERITKRSIVIEGDLVAGSCAGTDYGREVMMQALLDECSGRMSCEGSRLLLKRHEICYTDPSPAPLIADPFHTYASDSFNRPDSATVGAVERGGYVWTETGTPSIVSNQLQLNSGDGIEIFEFEHADVAVAVRWISGTTPTLTARNKSIRLRQDGGNLTLRDATDSVVGSAPYTFSAGDRMELVVRGAEAAGLINGVEIVTGPATWVATQQDVGVESEVLLSTVDDFSAQAVIPNEDDGSRSMDDVYLVSFEDTTPDDGYPCCQGAKLTIVLEAETPYLFGTQVEPCWNQQRWDLTTSYCPPMTIVDQDVDPPVPTQPVEVETQRKKRRLAIEVRHDGTWCSIGWNQANADGTKQFWLPAFTEFDGVDFVEPDDEFHYTRLKYDNTNGAFTWSPLTFTGNYQPCDRPSRVAQLEQREHIPAEAEDPPPDPPPFEVISAGNSYSLDVQLNIDFTVTPLGWDPADSGGFPPQTNFRIVNQCPDAAVQITEPPCGEGECKIRINDNGTWTAVGWNHDPLQPFPPRQEDTGCTGVIVDQDDDLIIDTITVDVPIEDCVAVPPNMAPFLPPPPPTPSTTSAYCTPMNMAILNCIIQSGTSWIDQVLDVSVFAGTTALRNCAIQVYPYDPNQDPDTPLGRDFYMLQDPVWFRRVGYIPKNSIWSYLGRSSRSLLDCGDGMPRSGEAGAWDPNNTAHPVLQCEDDYVVMVTADVANTAADAWVSASAVRREFT